MAWVRDQHFLWLRRAARIQMYNVHLGPVTRIHDVVVASGYVVWGISYGGRFLDIIT